MPIIMNVVGARPQFIKAAPVSRALQAAGLEEVLVHTGQHYDDLMSDSIMRDIGLRHPDVNLGVGSGRHGEQTAKMLAGIEDMIVAHGPDAVITYGDTNSTLAGALAAVKLDVLTAHVEAGLRSFNRQMPEEHNRVVTDHVSDLLLAPTEVAMKNLRDEGLSHRSVLTGDVMVDALMSIPLESIALPPWATGRFFVSTLHRPANTDDSGRLRDVLEALARLDHPVHLIAHPRLELRMREAAIETDHGGLEIHDPLPYSVMLAVVKASQGIITDSGGLQKEAFLLGVPCTTLRDETEWTETLAGKWNVLAGKDLTVLGEHVARRPSANRGSPFGGGDAAQRVVESLIELLNER